METPFVSQSEDDDTSSESSCESLSPSERALDTVEAVKEAAEAAKAAVLETSVGSDARRELVKKLVRLRIRLQELLEQREDEGEEATGPFRGLDTSGHRFVPYGRPHTELPQWSAWSTSRRTPCQRCGHAIWLGAQASFHCRDCGYALHATCVTPDWDVARACVHAKVRSRPDFITDICPERSLARLNYRCVECDIKLSWDEPAREPRLCDYTGLSFCPACNWGETAATPARVVHNWDFTPSSVSQAAKQYLFLMHK